MEIGRFEYSVWVLCLSTEYKNNGTLHGVCKLKGPTDGRDISHCKYAKMTEHADGVELARCRVEQTCYQIELTHWQSWADSLQNWADSLTEWSWLADGVEQKNLKYQKQLNKLTAELRRRTEFDEQRRRVELYISRTIEYDVTRKIWIRHYMENVE